jgi:hypothetical protein
MIRINRMVREVSIFREESVLQGQVVGATIKLYDNSFHQQNEVKNWCYENINNILLPKMWLFE